MKKNITISLIQSYIYWQDKTKNLKELQQKFENLNSDIIVLPEMFNTGFNINPLDLAETNNGPTVKWMKEQAKRTNSAIIGSIIAVENNKFFNRLFFVKPDSQFAYYDKRHTFTMAGENKYFSRGINNIIVNYLGWKIKPLVCYDLRFPVWARNKENYDILIYVANWPHSRIKQWESLVIARAIENQAYTIAVNRVGDDGNNFYYSGNSLVISPKGEIIAQAPIDQEVILTVNLDYDELQNMRQKFPVLRDMDKFSIENESIKFFW